MKQYSWPYCRIVPGPAAGLLGHRRRYPLQSGGITLTIQIDGASSTANRTNDAKNLSRPGLALIHVVNDPLPEGRSSYWPAQAPASDCLRRDVSCAPLQQCSMCAGQSLQKTQQNPERANNRCTASPDQPVRLIRQCKQPMCTGWNFDYLEIIRDKT